MRRAENPSGCAGAVLALVDRQYMPIFLGMHLAIFVCGMGAWSFTFGVRFFLLYGLW
jgi:hypothetical protein